MSAPFAAAPPQPPIGLLNGPVYGAIIGVLAALIVVFVLRIVRRRR